MNDRYRIIKLIKTLNELYPDKHIHISEDYNYFSHLPNKINITYSIYIEYVICESEIKTITKLDHIVDGLILNKYCNKISEVI